MGYKYQRDLRFYFFSFFLFFFFEEFGGRDLGGRTQFAEHAGTPGPIAAWLLGAAPFDRWVELDEFVADGLIVIGTQDVVPPMRFDKAAVMR